MNNIPPSPSVDSMAYKAGDNLYQFILLGALLTFTLMLLDERVRPNKKERRDEWWYMQDDDE